ncbi:MAG TPA: nitrilase-related carbon-nitrogen hydrolase [Nitrospirota bacterium]
MRFKIAAVQFTCSERPEKNLAKAAELALYAIEHGAKVVAFQQLFHLPWFLADKGDEGFAFAEGLDGPAVTLMREIAAKGDAVIVCPIFEKADDGKYYNTAVVIDADGTVAGKYRKVHIPDIPLWREKSYFSPGSEFPVIQTKHLKIGVQLCWDIFFPEGFRALALKGAQLIVVPTAAAFATAKKWERMAAAAATSNGVYVLRVNRVGGSERQRFYGRSFLVNPFGETPVEPTGKSDCVFLTDYDSDELEEARELWNFFGDRRPEAYGDLVEGTV